MSWSMEMKICYETINCYGVSNDNAIINCIGMKNCYGIPYNLVMTSCIEVKNILYGISNNYVIKMALEL